ncbi:MAG TPA: TolC family protein [Sulfurimonas autotrophica]|uniref:TolC family protein n=1 Tax=Sulfurimonas autotrophica TaxID=202747 RepID=A0A7C3GJ23_9BACT|nr:TolC family protein [Sulfurimonas autotrophica]
MNKIFFSSLLLFSLLNAETLTLQESIDATLQNYPDVKSLQMKMKQSKLSHRSATADYLPQVNLNGQYNFTQTYVFPVNGAFHTQDDAGWNAGVNLKQKVWDFSKTTSKIAATQKDEDISKLSLMDLKALLAFKVKSFYKLMVVQREAVNVRRKDLEAKKAYYAQAEALVKQGLKTRADASRFLSAVYNAEDNLAIAQASFDKARNSLSLYMDRKIDENVTLESAVLQENFNADANVEKEVFASNYTLKIENKNIEKNILLHKSAKAEHYGSIDAVASYNHFDTLNIYDATTAGVVINIPLYSGGRVSAEAQKVEISAQISKEQKRSRELALKEELENLLLDIKRYNKTISAKKAQIDSAQETKKVLDGRYKEGLATYIEVLDATTQVLNAKLSLLEAYYLRALSIDRIQYLKGKI